MPKFNDIKEDCWENKIAAYRVSAGELRMESIRSILLLLTLFVKSIGRYRLMGKKLQAEKFLNQIRIMR